MTFENDEARRAYFSEELRKKLQDPEFRKIKGFPIGSDEDILNLSDPPYYTACPNPFLASHVEEYSRPSELAEKYSRIPFASDVKEGRHEPIYLAHTYHTKVPWKAVLPFVLAYTKPGDLVVDGFAGTGMVGVACRKAGEPALVHEASQRDGVTFNSGGRRCVVSDISPIATHIASVYNAVWSFEDFEHEAASVLREAYSQVGQLYRTVDKFGDSCEVKYYVWSDVFGCPSCGHEDTYYGYSYSKSEKTYLATFKCRQCDVDLAKNALERRFETVFDSAIGSSIRVVKQRMVLRSYINKKGRRIHESCCDVDLDVLSEVQSKNLPDNVPTEKIPYMHMTHERNNLEALGVTHFHHFFTRRNAIAISCILEAINKRDQPMRRALTFWLTSCLPKLSRLMNYNADGIGRVTKGIFYFASVSQEFSPFAMLQRSIRDLRGCFDALRRPVSPPIFVGTSAAQHIGLPDSSVDYIFTDPPFGENIYYADLNYIWEQWLRVRTNFKDEAIVSKCQESPKLLSDYVGMMTDAFSEYYRVLKPGRWITVEFHNSENRVWRGIQEALGVSGFVIGDIRVLDKKLKTFKQIVAASTMKQDLVISAYKPSQTLLDKFELTRANETSAWEFVREHLRNVPVFVKSLGKVEIILERTPQMLMDRMIAFHVQRGVEVPVVGAEFVVGLAQKFSERDGMYFLPEQVAEYDRKRVSSSELGQLALFVTDEESAIQWTRQLLHKKPQTFQDLQPQFMREIQSWMKHERTIELREILEQNFLRYDGRGPVPEQIHAYLSTNWKELRNLPKDDPALVIKARDRWYVPDPNKAGDLEKLRERSLLKEFEEYKEAKKKLKVFRLEAVRAGFKKAWQERDYAVIIKVAEKIPSKVLEEDPKLLMWYDQAVTRMGGE
jgi:16S rRNA G966 N2-methylase RsmD